MTDLPAATSFSAIAQQYETVLLGTQGENMCVCCNRYFCSLTRRHIGAARTRDTSPATISNWAS